jgi:nicotinamide riboside transporter PnuC
MKAYIITSGVIFGLVTIAHLLRIAMEGRHLAEPLFILITLASAALSIWAWLVLRRANH